MPYESPLFDFLDDIDLQQYHQEFVSKLGVTALDHLSYVQHEDVSQLGMSQPEWRRLRASMKKVKKANKKGGKHASRPPPPLSKVTAPGPGAHPSGGHIIPPTDINIMDKELGRGEFGKVMQGLWTNKDGNKIPVAVKCLSPDKLAMDKCQQDFLKEAAIMHSLNHDHLVKLYGVVLDVNSSLMLVTEFAPLRSLSENIKQEALKPSFPITLLLDFSVQMADAMRYLHMSNIIHRDLAARNILLFVDDEGNKKVKISDFGLSRRLLLGENYRSEMRPNLKLPLAWMPVESLTKLTFTKASDVWSFGVTMWEMFSYGRQPWTTLSGEEILKSIDKPKTSRLDRPEACPLKIYHIMNRCWAHEPDERMSFNELCQELPKLRPVQVRTLTHHTGLHPEELTFRADDIVTVIDMNEDTGVWKGINPMGKIGYFQRADTVALGNSQSGKLKRWRSGRAPKTDNRRSKLSLEDISKPKDYKHIFHVGVDGKVEGDPTFGGDYRNIPENEQSSPSLSSDRTDSKPSTPTKSPAKPKKNSKKSISSPIIELSKETILPPPNGFESGSTVSVPDVVPSITTQVDSCPPPKAPVAVVSARGPPPKPPVAVLAEPEITTYTNGTSSNKLSDNSKHGTKPTKVKSQTSEDLSSFEMGSLLDDMMSVWDSAKLNLGFSDALETTPEEPEDSSMAEEEDSLLEGEENELCNGDASLSRSTNRIGEENLVMEAVGDGSIATEARGEDVGSASRSEEELGAVGGANAVGSGTGGKDAEGPILTGNIIIKDSMTKPTKTYRKAPRQAPSSEEESGESVAKPEAQVQEQSQPVRSRPGREANPVRRATQEKRWDSEFKRLSSSQSDRSMDNDYVDTNDMQRKGTGSSEEYEELALASSPQPYTLRDSVLDSANVVRGPRFGDVSRSISMRTARPSVEVVGEFNRSRSLREPPVSPLGQQAYESLVGGDISGNARRKRSEGTEKKAPAVPPKPAPKPPSRVKPRERPIEGRVGNGDARVPGSVSPRSYSGTSSDDGTVDSGINVRRSEDLSNSGSAVASLRQKFSSNISDDLPPRPPPREPVDQTKVSSYAGVRLRRREQSNPMTENFYAAEHENNNAYTEKEKLTSDSLQNLEQQLPRRTRRSIGEDRIKRRSSSDASDSEGDVSRGRSEQTWSVSTRTSEADSSSDETLSSGRLSTSSNERGSFSENRGIGQRLPPRPLYDLPEDQTNSNRNRTPPQLLHPHQDGRHDDIDGPPPRPPRLPCDVTATAQGPHDALMQSSYWTRPPDGADLTGQSQLSVPPPRPERRNTYDRMQRSKTFDSSSGVRDCDAERNVDYSHYDVLPVHRPVGPPTKSHSVDVVDFSDSYIIGSAASIRQLLEQDRANRTNNNYNNDGYDADNIDDMPELSPPPVPTNRKSFTGGTYGELPLDHQPLKPQANVVPVQRQSIREPDYILMKPQTDIDVKLEYQQRSEAESNYAVPRTFSMHSSHPSISTPSHNQSLTSNIQSPNDKPPYELMRPSRVQNGGGNAKLPFARTKSDDLPSRPYYLSAPRPVEQRRGTVASSSLRRRDHTKYSGGQSGLFKMRKSRSFDNLLRDKDGRTMPHEAESLSDLLARAYVPPDDRLSQLNISSNYMVPPSARRNVPVPPSPKGHHFISTPPPTRSDKQHSHTPPPESSSHGEADYLDMSQASLERRKKQRARVNRSEPVDHAASSPSPVPHLPKPAKSSQSSLNQLEPVQAASISNTLGTLPAQVAKPVPAASNQPQLPDNQTNPVCIPEPFMSARYKLYDPDDDEVDL